MGQNLVGMQAPLFSTQAVVQGAIDGQFSLERLRGRYVFLFFYPLDFTFVCPTELHAFQEQLVEFHRRDAEVIGCSVDSVYAHLAWMREGKEKGGIQGISYPLLSDVTKEICRAYGVLKEKEGISYRAQFLIDREGVIHHQLINDLPLGRSVDEALRLLDALIFAQTHGQVCPANWNAGRKGMIPSKQGVCDYFQLQSSK